MKEKRRSVHRCGWGTRCFSLQRVLASSLVGAGQSPMHATIFGRPSSHANVTRRATARAAEGTTDDRGRHSLSLPESPRFQESFLFPPSAFGKAVGEQPTCWWMRRRGLVHRFGHKNTTRSVVHKCTSRELAPWRGSGSSAPSGGSEAEPPQGSRAGGPGAVSGFRSVAETMDEALDRRQFVPPCVDTYDGGTYMASSVAASGESCFRRMVDPCFSGSDGEPHFLVDATGASGLPR